MSLITAVSCALVMYVATCGLAAVPRAAAAETTAAVPVFPDPGLTDPRLRFHLGEAGPKGPIISPVMPKIPGPPSAWFVTQWGQGDELLRPDAMTENNLATRDALFGVARYAFSAPDGHSHVWIYDDKVHKQYVYDLYERGGVLGPKGGSNLFLSADASRRDATLDHAITYSVSLKLSRASITFNTPGARTNGVVLAQVFSGFIFHVQPRRSDQNITVFLQIQHASSRNRPSGYYSCRYKGRDAVILDGRNLPSEPQLRFTPGRGALRRLHYLLNARICALLGKPLPCADQAGRRSASVLSPQKLSDFARWRLTSMYVGLETEDRDMRPGSIDHDPQGSVGVGLQIEDIRVMSDAARLFNGRACLGRRNGGLRP